MTARRRSPAALAGALALALVAAACAGGTVTVTPTDTTAAGDRGGPPAPPTGGGGDGPAGGNGTTAPPGGAAVDDRGRLGTAGRALLSPAVPEAVVEVDRAPGVDLAIDPRAVLARRLEAHGGKTVAGGGDGTVPAQDVYTAADLRRLAADHRQTRSTAGRVSVYLLVLNGRFEDERVTGVAFAATAIAVFPEQIGGGLLGANRSGYEEAVTVHELGHLFGLVNLTGHGDFHEDPEHPGHARSDGSVMYWAIERAGVAELLRGGPPRDFDDADREEMARIRTG